MSKVQNKLLRLFIGKDNYSKLKQANTTKPSEYNKPVGFEGGLYGFQSSNTDQKQFLRSIRGWTYANINAIAEQVAFVFLRLYVKKNDSIDEVMDNPLIDTLQRVNEYTTFFDHMWLTAAYLESVGEAPWFLDKQEDGTISGIYIVDPSKLTPMPDPQNKRLIGGYKFDLGRGKYEMIPSDQIVPLKYPDPSNPVRGLGTMQAASRAIDIDNASEKWNFNFFSNNATPGAKFKVNTKNLTPEQKKKIKHSIESQYKGVENAHQLWVLFNDMDVEPFGTAPKDMDFKAQAEWYADKIRGIFRVPRAMLAQTEGVNLASAQVSERVFIQNVIKPKLERIVQQLNEFYLPQFVGTEAMFLDFDDPAQEDTDTKLKTYENALKNGWMTINEVRKNENLEDIGENGDIIYLPVNMQSIETSAQGLPAPVKSIRLRHLKAKDKTSANRQKIVSKLALSLKTEMMDEVKKKLHSQHKVEDKVEQWNEDKKKNFWVKQNDVVEGYKPKFKKLMNTVFDDQEKEVLKKLKAGKSIKANIPNLSLNSKVQAEKVLQTFVPTIELLMVDSSEEAFKFLGLNEVIDVSDDLIQDFIKSRTIKFANASTETTNEAIKTAIAEGIKEGEGVSVLSKRISGVFDGARDYRSDRIAISETTRFNAEATEQAYIESGEVESKEWVVNPDACPYCLGLEGATVELGGSYAKLGDKISGEGLSDMTVSYETLERPPAHANCRCTIAPVLKPLKSMKLTKSEKDVIKMKKENKLKNDDVKEMVECACEEHKKETKKIIEQKNEVDILLDNLENELLN